MKKLKLWMLISVVVGSLTGCVTPPKPLYYHGDHATAVYSYLKADDLSISEQIMMMEDTLQKANNSGLPTAPGFHAHLGLLYLESGNTQAGIEQLNIEKSMYPESTQFIDFLLGQLQGSKKS
jgi:hypothetical protein